MKIEKCINCGATLQHSKCNYCHTDYRLNIDFKEQIENTADSKLKDYYKLLDIAFNSGNYAESYNYATNILEIEPDNKEVWSVNIYSAVNNLTVDQIESGTLTSILEQLANTTPEHANKILFALFNYSIHSLKYETNSNIRAMLKTAMACLDHGLPNTDENAKLLYKVAIDRRQFTQDASSFSSAEINMIKTKYITTEIYKPVAQKDTVGFGFGIASLPLFFVGIFGLLGLFFSIRTLKKTKNSKAETAKADRTYATIGLALSSVGLLFTLLFGFTYLKEEYVKVAAVTKKDKIEITFVQMEKYSFQRNEDGLSPDIYIYQVKINDPKDSAKLEDAIILKCKEERKYTDSYYYFADVEIPTLIKNKVWNEAIDFFEKTNAVAIIDIDRSGDDRSYRIKNKDGKLSKMIKL